MANLYDLKKFDLNLLVIFECIYQNLSISKAAETLYITPSAVSQSLQRLRTQLNDPLFIRAGKGITPTTVGVNLHHHLEQNLNQIEQTINVMNESHLKKNFVIYCPQIILQGRLVELMTRMLDEGNYNIDQYDMLLSPDSAEDLLAYRKADLVFTFAPINNRSVISTRFHTLPMILAARADHPRIKDIMSQEDLQQEKFTQFRTQESGVKDLQTQAEIVFPDRTIAFRGDSYISILNVICASDLLGYMPAQIFERYKDLMNLRKVNINFPLPTPEIFMQYNRSALNNRIFAQFIESMDKD